MTTRLPTLLAVATLLSTGCSRDPGEHTFSQNVAKAFEPCSEAEIRYLAGKHNFQTAFRECGSNNFHQFSWSPDGTKLYFSFTLSHHVMYADAADKHTINVPADLPAGEVEWLSPTQLALPVRPPHGQDSPWRVQVFDVEQQSLFEHELPGLTDLDHLHRAADPRHVYLSADDGGGRRAWSLSLDDGSVEPAFTWLEPGFATLTVTATADALAVGRDGHVTLYRTDGTQLGTWERAERGVLNADGRWLALEFKGDPVSIFFQRHWDELSDKARERELRRAQRFEEHLPEHYQTEVRPPTLSVVDLTSGERWYFSSFLGDQFEWYEPTPYFCSMRLWGFEGKECNPNVILGDLSDRFRAIERGEEMMGVNRWGEDPPSPTDGEPTPDEPTDP